MEPFGLSHYRQAVHATTELALQTDKGIVLAASVLDALRHRRIILPTLDVIERICAEAHPSQQAYLRSSVRAAVERAPASLRRSAETTRQRQDWLAWLRQSPAKPNSRHMLEHIERLKAWQELDLPIGIERHPG